MQTYCGFRVVPFKDIRGNLGKPLGIQDGLGVGLVFTSRDIDT